MGVAILEKLDQVKGCREGGEGVHVLAEEENGYCYQCLESGLSVAHIPKANLAGTNFPY